MNFLVELCVSSMSTMIAIAFLLVFYVIMGDGLTVTINTDVTGIEGSKGTYIQCMFNKEDVDRINYVYIQAFRNTSFISVVGFVPNRSAGILPQQDYLYGRVAMNNITQSSTKVELEFTNLLCVDDTDYRCLVNYVSTNTGLPVDANSQSLQIHVQVLPSKPNFIEILNTTQSSHDGTKSCKTKLMGCISSSPEGSIKNETNCRKHDDYNSKIMFLEGDMISIVCQGNIGKPPDDLVVQMIRTTGQILSLTAIENETCEITDKCTFYQNNSFTINVTYADNGAMFRCAVKSLMNTDKMYIQTYPIDVQFPVRIPHLTVEHDQDNIDLEMRPKILTCSSLGNPLPDYKWYKAISPTYPRQWEFYSNMQTIILNNATDKGDYRCNVSNIVSGQMYFESKEITVSFAAPDEPTSETSTSWILVVVICGTCGGVGAVGGFVITLIRISRKRRRDRTTPRQKQSKTPTETNTSNSHVEQQRTTSDAKGTENYGYESKDNEGFDGGSDAEYVSLSQEESTQHNDSKRSHKPVEVKHPQTHGSNQQTDDSCQSTVPKVKNCISHETPYEDIYESGDGIYDKIHDRRHKKIIESEPFDKTASLSWRTDNQGGHTPMESTQQTEYSNQPTVYAQVNQVTMIISQETQYDEDHYESGDGMYDKSYERRHKESKESETFDTTACLSRRSDILLSECKEVVIEYRKIGRDNKTETSSQS